MHKIYHIVHIDRLKSIIETKGLFSDSIMRTTAISGTDIGLQTIKDRRLHENELQSHSGLFVGQCVPFYFCPRSVMLYMIYMKNSTLSYDKGQNAVIHLVLDLNKTIHYAESHSLRWAFTSGNAGSYYFEDYHRIDQLSLLNWEAINARNWSQCKDPKQAEFLLEKAVSWELVESIGAYDKLTEQSVLAILNRSSNNLKPHPTVEINRDWCY